MRKVNAQGTYTVPKDFDNAGEVITFDYEYEVYDSLQEAIEGLGGEDKVLAMLNQTHKEDCRNNASGRAKAQNGHSPERTLTPEEKEKRKAQRQADRQLLKLIKEKGLSLADLSKL